MDPAATAALIGVADKVTSFALILLAMIAGSRGIWVWASVVKEKDREIAELKAKLDSQERLIDRLSGVADRSIDLSHAAFARHGTDV